ncbi:MAG: hypothetical protein R3D66_04670 [Alphaproteobacteria bacterium]
MKFDDFKLFLPKYLSEEDQKKLFSELKSFPENANDNFYSKFLMKQKNLFQGDGFTAIQMPDHKNKDFKEVKGFLVSNTCDANPSNTRLYPSFLMFAPIFDLKKYRELLEKKFNDKEKISQHINAIQNQRATSFFYLPKQSCLNECFVRMDMMFSMPASIYSIEKLCNNRLFVLSNLGHYVLLFKLSVHFSRVQEALKRA